MIKLTNLITEKIKISHWKTGWDIITDFDKISQFKKYRIKDAEYDDQFFIIPTSVFTQVTGLTEKDVIKISNQLESYEGNIDWNNTNLNKYKENTVVVMGGA